MAKPNRREYTPAIPPPGCVVTIIEMVTPSENVGDIPETLEALRRYSGAEVVDQFYIKEGEDAAFAILDSRAIRDYIGAP